MRKHTMAAVLGFLVVAFPADAQQGKDGPKSRYIERVEGKTLDEWIRLIHSKDRSVGQKAIRNVLGFGVDRAFKAVPHIVAELKRHRPPSYPIDTSIRVNGVIALGTILGAAKDPDPKLLHDAVNQLRKLSRDTQVVVRYRAAEALGKIGKEAKIAVPELLSMLRERATWETRKTAAIALGFIARNNDEGPELKVLNYLFSSLKGDPASQVRLACIQSLTFLGAPANPVHKKEMMDLLALVSLRDKDYTVRIWANMAIMSINRKIENARVVPIAKLIQYDNVAIQIQAIQALGTIGPKAKASVPFLTKGLQDRDSNVVSWCIWALARMEGEGKPAVPMLITIAQNEKFPKLIRTVAQQAADIILGKKMKKKTQVNAEE